MPKIQDNNPPSPQPNDQEHGFFKSATPLPPPSTTPKEEKPLPPIKYPPFLWEKSQNLLRDLEQKVNAKTLVYFTNPAASISNDDVEYFFSHVREIEPETSLNLILISGGGSILAAWRVANVLRNYCKTLTILIPSSCASAATLLALSAEKLLFGPAGFLTAIDTSLNHPLNPRPTERELPSGVSVDQINRVKEFINEDLKNHQCGKGLSEILFEKIHPVVFGELQRTSSLSKLVAKNMMKLRINPPSEEDQSRIADILNDSYPAHGYPIVLKEAQEIGLPAEPVPQDLNSLLWELTKLYSIISRKVITNLTPTLYHLEVSPVIIESSGKRTFFSVSYNKRLMPQPELGWVVENDKSRWLSAAPNPETPGKAKLSELEL